MIESVLEVRNVTQNSFATCFAVKQDGDGTYFVTCGHVVNSEKDQITVSGHNAKIVQNFQNEGLDICLINVKGLIVSPLKLKDKKNTTSPAVIGYSRLGSKSAVSTIKVNDLFFGNGIIEENQPIVETIKIKHSDQIDKGYSGSPLVCEDSKEVIGVVFLKKGGDTNLAIRSKHLIDVLSLENSINDGATVKVSSSLCNINAAKVEEKLSHDFEDSISYFKDMDTNWFDVRVYKEPDRKGIDDEYIRADDILKLQKSIHLISRSQFGATSLSRYLALQAWNKEQREFWLYIDLSTVRPYLKDIRKYFTKNYAKYCLSESDISYFIFDNFDENNLKHSKLLREIKDKLPLLKFFAISKVDTNKIIKNESDEFGEVKFLNVYLHSLKRNQVREIVEKFEDGKFLDNADATLTKLISDLETINLPRTTYNCISLLKSYEYSFDTSPINRAEVIHRLLSLTFNYQSLPTYKAKPDLKDTEHILGYLCEKLIRTKNYYFSSAQFHSILNEFCEDNDLEIDVSDIFQIMLQNYIIIYDSVQNDYKFRFSYWINYFGAHRMFHSASFYEFIVDDEKFLNFPEIIEFYSAIDRRRNDLVIRISDKLKNIDYSVSKKLGLPTDFTLFDQIQWEPSSTNLEEMEYELDNGIRESNLPTSLKDHYADRNFEPNRHLDQEIIEVLNEYHVMKLMQCIKSLSRVVRNSTYVEKDHKYDAMKQIANGWLTFSKVLFMLTPALAMDRVASIDGAHFTLDEGYSDNPKERLVEIILHIPFNIFHFFEEDLYSDKFGKILLNTAIDSQSKYIKHILDLIIITKRPSDWEKYLRTRINEEDKNSFYLLGIRKRLTTEIQYSFASAKDLKHMKDLYKETTAKHFLGHSRNKNKISDKNVPPRDESSL